MAKSKVALLTAGGMAPCLSAAVGSLIQRYTQRSPQTEIIGYRNGYQGVLTGRSIPARAQGSGVVWSQVPPAGSHLEPGGAGLLTCKS